MRSGDASQAVDGRDFGDGCVEHVCESVVSAGGEAVIASVHKFGALRRTDLECLQVQLKPSLVREVVEEDDL